MRARLRAAFEHWRDVRELTDAQAADVMRTDGLDVLIDLKGHTRGTRLAILGHRPAPVEHVVTEWVCPECDYFEEVDE